MRRRRTIIQRKPIFFGCEGESELGYGARLSRLIRELPGIHLHINAVVLQPGAGDPHVLVQRAVQKIVELERRREAFICKAILLDLGTPEKNLAARQYAARYGIEHLIWQQPDHEAFLLRHLDGCDQLRPPAGQSLAALRQRWPDYEKGRTQVQLANYIDLDSVRRASNVEPDLRRFLRAIGAI
jgi:hypothetical protein